MVACGRASKGPTSPRKDATSAGPKLVTRLGDRVSVTGMKEPPREALWVPTKDSREDFPRWPWTSLPCSS